MTICQYSIYDVIPRIQTISRSKLELTAPFEEFVRKFSEYAGTVLLLSGTNLDCARYNILAAKPWLTITAKGENIFICFDGKITDKCLNTVCDNRLPYGVIFDNDNHFPNGKTFASSGDPLEFVNALIKHYSTACSELFFSEQHLQNALKERESASLDEELNSNHTDTELSSDILFPISAGLFGYLAYDLKDRIETLPNTCMDQNLPDLYLCAPSIIILHDRHTNSVEQILIQIENGSANEENSLSDSDDLSDCKNLSDIKENLTSNDNSYSYDISYPQSFSIDPAGFSSNFSKYEYIQAVEKIIEYIKAGDIYQVNLSQRFSAGFEGSPYSLFLKLFEKNPAPFFSFINAGDHQIVSTSPERFIKRCKDVIETRPIKGTIPRAKRSNKDNTFKAEQDRVLRETLLNSFKDDAELSMIVDLMRNDFGKVAVGGTVRVKEHKRLEAYDNVFHLVSIVEAVLASDKSSIDLIRATFPGGSITGCPKIRSMEIIDEIESVRRHIYTGAIGYISFHDTLDLSIAIRTAVVGGGKIGFSVGGGIVFDSDPEKEYEETLHKGKTIIDTLIASSSLIYSNQSDTNLTETNQIDKGNPLNQFSIKKAWVNGKIIDENKVVIPANYTGFQYGAGLFETMRVEKGKVLRLQHHLDRISSSWATLFREEIPQIGQISWKNVIANLVQLNGLDNKTAAVKLMVASGERGKSLSNVKMPNKKDIKEKTDESDAIIEGQIASVDGQSDFVAAFIRPYKHRLELTGKNGLDLITFPERRHTPLASHKSLNYLYYHLASVFAKENQCDEAIICNADGTVSETNSGNIVAVSITDGEVIVPESDYSLPGITLNAALKLFSNAGYDVVERAIDPFELYSMENILVMNALMGVVRVLSIDGHEISHTEASDSSGDICCWLNRGLMIGDVP